MDLPGLVKRLAWLCVFIAAAAAVYLAWQLPRHGVPFARKIKQAGRIRLEQDARKIDLYREGKEWTVGVSSGSRFATQGEKVASLLLGLESVQVEDEISSRMDRAGDFEVTPSSGLYIALYGKNDRRLVEGIFGKQAPDFNHIYFRYPNRPSVYLARGVIRGELGEADLNQWRRRTLVSLPEAQIQRVQIKGLNYQTSLARSSDIWTLDGKPVEPEPVYGLIGSLAHLQADSFAEGVPFTDDQFTFATIHVEGAGSSVDLRIGREDPATKRHLVSAGPQTGLAWVSADKIKPLLLKPSAFKPKKP